MKKGDQMKGYGEVFGVAVNQRSYPFDVTLVDSEPAGNVLAPGEQPKFQLLITNNQATPVKTAGKIDVIAYGTQGIPGDIWLPQVVKFADLSSIPISVDLPAKGSRLVEVAPALPEKFGAYALVVDLGAAGRRFATTCVRTFAASPERIQYPRLSLDESAGLPVLRRLSVQAIRLNYNYIPRSDKNYAEETAKLKARLKEFADNNITVLLMFLSGVGSDGQPLGRGRPHLSPEGVMLNTKQDLAWLPEYDADFQKFVADLCTDCGWPKGPITAVELWNEPWEGISISGWGADSVRFRTLFTAMARGVETARKNGADVLITGCDSSSNTLDKLFADGTDTYLKWLDACTLHYQGISVPSIYRQWLDRKGPHGRVKIWDTESWVANTDDRVSAVIAGDRAAGYDRAMGVYSGNVSSENSGKVVMPDGTRRDVLTYDAWSTAASVGAAQHLIGERDFRELLFKNGLPWVMVFDGSKDHPDDGTLVVVGDLGETFETDKLLFRGVRGLAELNDKEALRKKLDALPSDSPDRAGLEAQLAAPEALRGASLTLPDNKGEFVLYDFYGNPVPAKDGMITVPLDNRGFFLRTNGSPGSFDNLVKAVSDARIEGYEPLDIVAHDMLSPIGEKSSLRLTLTNVLNRPVTGKLTISLGNLTLDTPATVSFGPNETRDVTIPITGGKPGPDNTYPLTVQFDADHDGYAVHRENLHVNVIAKRTIKVDGSLDDWAGVLPQTVVAGGNQGPSLMESAWLPFAKFDAAHGTGMATGYLAYDEKNFYFAAKIADASPSPGTLRYAKRNDDDYFYPKLSYEYDGAKTLLRKDEVWQVPSRNQGALFLPGSDTQRSFAAWSSVASAFAVDMDLPKNKYTKVSFYFVDWDDYKIGRRRVFVEARDAMSGKLLAQTLVKEFGPGNYATFLLSGKVRLAFRSDVPWLTSSLSGIFLDPADSARQPPAGDASAVFVSGDLQTGAHWQGRYGKDGYNIIGADPHYPAWVQVSVPEIAVKTDHQWPDGVRQYSYRKRPDLPFGTAPNKFDNVQIAFNVIPLDEKADMVPNPPGTMPRFLPYHDTDYEYALNPVAADFGGGTEIWRSLTPGMPRKHFYPRQPASPYDGPVKDGSLAIRQDGNTRIVEAAIPWTEIPLVRKALDQGKTIRFSFRVNESTGPAMELAEGRSVSKKNTYTFHPDWVDHWANEVEFSFEK